MENSSFFKKNDQKKLIVEEFNKYFSLWPYFFISVILFILTCFLFLRYTSDTFRSTAKIEIIDDAMDSEMALPTEMTIFNRSTINLENEIGVLQSFSLHSKVVKDLMYNVEFYDDGRLKSTKLEKDVWLNNNKNSLEFLQDLHLIEESSYYDFDCQDGKIEISRFDSYGNFFKKYLFKSNTTKSKTHDLPFDLTIKPNSDFKNKSLHIKPFTKTVNYFKDALVISPTAKDSDQLLLTLDDENFNISNNYINKVISDFDNDGVKDRQLEYQRTMEFVDSRSDFLMNELALIENKKRQFKEDNYLTNIENDASLSISSQLSYNSDLFEAKSQKDLIVLFKESLDSLNLSALLPANVGIQNDNLNELIIFHNSLVNKRMSFLSNSGPNNSAIKNINQQISDSFKNILFSIKNIIKSLDTQISNLSLKEKEFEDNYLTIPENEKILRSIERELEIKESLFLLLLQKREEAAINFAVVKPSIKVIDYAINSQYPVSPNKPLLYLLSVLLGLFIPFTISYLYFYFDSKIHTRNQLKSLLPNIGVVGEIPFLSTDPNKLLDLSTRSSVVESFRMILVNLSYTFKKSDDNNCSVILVTSSVKGEGKTIVSSNLANVTSASEDKKVLLIGADLRNPQIHKFFALDKSVRGLSDYIFSNDNKIDDYIIHKNSHDMCNCDLILSGIIPPNPTELLSSDKFKNLISELRNLYDYIFIDSAPCVLVSDTFEISNLCDSTVYVVRSNYTEQNLSEFINEIHSEKKLNKLNLVLNSVGSSSAYGYKYGYSYSYRYNYGYGYGYGSSEQ